jgi:acyl phosphate:glycerol-3-phosphate acyltransferase
MTPTIAILIVAAYLYGSIPFGFLAAQWLRGVDIRTVGSGNVGATNACRAIGFKFFPAVFLLDMSKGFLPALLMQRLMSDGAAQNPHPLVLAAGLAALVGHVLPIYLRFRGGKAVAAGTGLFLVVAPWAVLICLAVWAAVFLPWRYVSLASIAAATTLPVGVALTHGDAWDSGLSLVVFSALAGLGVVLLHRTNIRRLLAGTEHAIGRGGDRKSEGQRQTTDDNGVNG